MNSKLERYVIESLAATGFCVVNASAAFRLRPDLWATRFDCGTSFNSDPGNVAKFLYSIEGVSLLEIQFSDRPDWSPLATRSEADLPSRIQYITGQQIVGLRPYSGGKAAPAPAAKVDTDNPIPGWACAERTRRLEEAGLPDNLHKPPQRFAGKRTGY
ncbi:MAG: hypothetical protein K2Y31_14230 [Burkholderiales bacterium]|jgi:hypothetical protein|nr:hypothetical protein [Burkholderiales bacterium]